MVSLLFSPTHVYFEFDHFCVIKCGHFGHLFPCNLLLVCFRFVEPHPEKWYFGTQAHAMQNTITDICTIKSTRHTHQLEFEFELSNRAFLHMIIN